MATYEIRSPEGHVYEVGAPDSASEQEVMSYFMSSYDGASPQTKADKMGATTGQVLDAMKATGMETAISETPAPSVRGELERAFLGATDIAQNAGLLGWGDELSSLVKSKMVPGGGTYDEEMAKGTQAKEAYLSNAPPGTELGLSLAGGLGTGLPLMPKTAGLGRIIGQGAVEGGIGGAGFADQGSKMEGGAIGTIFGGGLPALLAGAGKVVPPMLRKGKEMWKGRGAPLADKQAAKVAIREAKDSVAADKIIHERVVANQTTPMAVGAEAKKLGKGATLADVVPDGRATLGRAIRESPEVRASEDVAQIGRRGRDTAKRIIDDVEGATGASARESEELGPLLLDTRRTNAKKMYGEAENIRLTNADDLYDHIDSSPTLRKVMKDASDDYEDLTGRRVKFVGEGENAHPDVGDAKLIQAMERKIRSRISDATSDLGVKSPEATRLGDIERKFRKVVEKGSDSLRRANAQYKSDTGLMRARQTPLDKFSKMTPAQTRAWWKGLSPAEKEVAEYGVVENLVNNAKKSSETGMVTSLKKIAAKEKMEVVFGKEKAQKIYDSVQREVSFAKTGRVAQAGKTGAETDFAEGLVSSRKAVGDLPTAYEAASFPTYGKFHYAVRKVIDVLKREKSIPEGVMKSLGEKLASAKDPQQAMLAISNSHLSREAKKKASDALFGAKVRGASLIGALTGEARQ